VDTTIPFIQFVNPTPPNASLRSDADIYVNITSTDTNRHYSFTNFDHDLLLWITFDEVNDSGDPTDLSSYGNNGTLVNNTLINSAGYWGDAGQFDGVGDYIELGDVENVDNVKELTVSAWVYHDSLDDDDGVVIKYSEITEGFMFFRDDVASGSARIDTYTILIDEAGGSGSQRIESSENASTLSNWTHVAFTYKEDTTKDYI